MAECKICGTEEQYIYGVTMLHFTGDPKRIRVTKCENCEQYYLYISVYAHSGSVTNTYEYRIDLQPPEAERLVENMKTHKNSGDIKNNRSTLQNLFNRYDYESKALEKVLLDDYEI